MNTRTKFIGGVLLAVDLLFIVQSARHMPWMHLLAGCRMRAAGCTLMLSGWLLMLAALLLLRGPAECAGFVVAALLVELLGLGLIAERYRSVQRGSQKRGSR